ncbi:MAG: endonuclease MutS2 [Gemmatimonadaceae bacterium]
MNAHALGVLELPRVLGLVAANASSSLGAAHVRGLVPGSDLGVLNGEHARVEAVRSLVAGDAPWHPEPLSDLTEPLTRLRLVGASWSAPELAAGALLLRSSRRTRDALRDPRRAGAATAVLAELTDQLLSDRVVEDRIIAVVGEDGIVRDDASPTLRRLRRELRAAEGELVRLLEREMARLPSHLRVDDASVTLRNGRYVIPVRREGRGALGGIVHDASATGGTLFVEPPAAIEFGNHIRELEAEERREVERILSELTDELRPAHDGLVRSLSALVELDSLYARARFAEAFRCAPATLCSPVEGFSVRDARHPLLVAQGLDVVPFTLEMAPGEQTLLVSGPNTGGKTVLLKALGLLSLLVQCGIPAPVTAGSRIAVYDDVFADVGDEQSIEASLSTFSAHLKNLGEILRLATHASLVLIDELGSGTDPAEGAALGGAILEALTARGTLSVATTHLGALKELATEVGGSGVVNASLQFDSAALAPTYRLIKGVPGRSYGLSIARRLKLPDAVLARAEARLPEGERDLSALIAALEEREAALADRERDGLALADEARRQSEEVAERERVVRALERDAERRGHKEARRYLLDARAEIDRVIAELKRNGAESVEESAREARRRVEALVTDHGDALAVLSDEGEGVRGAADRGGRGRPESLALGDLVEVGTLGGRVGRLVELRDGEGVVAVGALKLAVALDRLTRSRLQTSPAERAPMAIVGDAPDVEARSEIDVRGLRVDEVDGALMQGLDAAIRADLHALRIIHGKGTGALRARVAELLRKDTRVRGFRLGLWNEGGAGVTVAEL